MTKEELEIGKFYTSGGEAIYKLEDIGTDWVLVLHYSTVHYVANTEFFKLDEFLETFYLEDDDWWDNLFYEDLVFEDFLTLKNKDKE